VNDLKKYWIPILSCCFLSSIYLSCSLFCKLWTYTGHFMIQCLAGALFLWAIYESVLRKICPSFCILPICLLCWGVLSIFWATSFFLVPSGLMELCVFVFLWIGLIYLFAIVPSLHEYCWKIVLYACLVPVIIYCFRLLLFYQDTLDDQLQRIFFTHGARQGYPFGNPNLAASVFSVCIIILMANLFFHWKEKSWKWKGIYSFLIIFFLCILLLLQRKGILINLFLVFLFLSLLRWKRYQKYFCMASIFGIVILCSTIPLWIPKFQYSGSIRLSVWNVCWEAITFSWQRFFFGWGCGNFLSVFEKFQTIEIFSHAYSATVVDFAHNYFLEFWMEYGLIGILCLLSMFTFVFYKGIFLYNHASNHNMKKNLFICLGIFLSSNLQACYCISMSYSHTQILFILACAWILFEYVQQHHKIKKRQKQINLLSVYILLCFYFLWIWLILPEFIFQIQYKLAYCAPYEKKLEKMVAVQEPLWETFYTLEWRCLTGEVLCNNSSNDLNKIQRAKQIFYKLETLLPTYDYFYLYYAILEGRKGNLQNADLAFITFAKCNPFFLDLWYFWGIQCHYQFASLCHMKETAEYYKKAYPEHGMFDLALGMVYHLEGNKEDALLCMEKAYKWSLQKINRFSPLVEKYTLDYKKQWQKKH